VVEGERERKRERNIPVAEAEGAFDLVDGGALSNDADISVEGTTVAAVNEVGVDKDKGLLDVEADGDDVHGVLQSKLVAVFEGEFGGVEELLVVGQHDNQGDVEDFLEIPG